MFSKENLPEPVERFSELFLGTPARIQRQTRCPVPACRGGRQKERAGFSISPQLFIPVSRTVRMDDWGWGPGPGTWLCPPTPRWNGQETDWVPSPGISRTVSFWPPDGRCHHPHPNSFFISSVNRWPTSTGSAQGPGATCGCLISSFI